MRYQIYRFDHVVHFRYPSVDHLLMLSELYQVHMEDLLVKKNIKLTMNIEDREEKSDIISDMNFTKRTLRLQAYFLKLYA